MIVGGATMAVLLRDWAVIGEALHKECNASEHDMDLFGCALANAAAYDLHSCATLLLQLRDLPIRRQLSDVFDDMVAFVAAQRTDAGSYGHAVEDEHSSFGALQDEGDGDTTAANEACEILLETEAYVGEARQSFVRALVNA